MKKIINQVLKFRFLVTAITGVALVLAMIAVTKVEINSDLYSYMPSDLESMEAADLILTEFNDPNTFQLLFRDTDQSSIDSFITELSTKSYDDKTLMESMEVIQVLENGVDFLYSLTINSELYLNTDEILEVVDIIDDVYESQNMTGGVTSGSIQLPTVVEGMAVMSIVIIITMLIVMVLFTPSFLEPVLLLTSIGIAVILNMGTNIIMPNGVSNVTFSIAALLQFAVSIDYSLILLGSFKKYRKQSMNIDDAISSAVAASYRPILTGAITTIAGFSALAFMKFEIGFDMGFVLAKGVLFSLLITLFILPILIKYTYKLHEKFSHRDFIPSFGSIGKTVNKKLSLALVITLFTLGAIGLVVKFNMDYIYGEPPMDATSIYISENFEQENVILVLFDAETDESKITEFLTELVKIDGLVEEDLANGKFTYMDSSKAVSLGYAQQGAQLEGLITACAADSSALAECSELPSELLTSVSNSTITAADAAMAIIKSASDENFFSVEGDIERIIIYLEDEENLFESEALFNTVVEVRELAHSVLGEESKITGETAVLYDMSILGQEDSAIVTILSVVGVALVLMIMFRSFTIPAILILTIQSSILISLSMSQISGSTLSYLGVVVVSAIMLGATIDYTVLLTENYQHARYTDKLAKKDAIVDAVSHSSHALLTSGLALTLMGFIQFMFADGTIAELGLLLGRGGLTSLLVALFIMPHILFIFDKVFIKESRMK